MSELDGPDLVVAGAGGGLVGALRAAELGLDVLVRRGQRALRRRATTPRCRPRWCPAPAPAGSARRTSTTRPSGSSTTSGPRPAARSTSGLARALVDVSARLVEWLADERRPWTCRSSPTSSYPGHSAAALPHGAGPVRARLLARPGPAACAASERVDLMVPATLVEVLTDDGRVAGVVVESRPRREEIPTPRRAARHQRVRRRPRRSCATTSRRSPERSTTAARPRAATPCGSARSSAPRTGYLDAYQGHAALAMPARHARRVGDGDARRRPGRPPRDDASATRRPATPSTPARSSCGRRRRGLDRARRADRRGLPAVPGLPRHPSSPAPSDWADDRRRRLAGRVGVDADGLAATLEETARCTAGDAEDRFGRTHWEAPLAPPYDAIAVRPALFHTQGGLRRRRPRPRARPRAADRSPACTPPAVPPPASPVTAPPATWPATGCCRPSGSRCWRPSTSPQTSTRISAPSRAPSSSRRWSPDQNMPGS